MRPTCKNCLHYVELNTAMTGPEPLGDRCLHPTAVATNPAGKAFCVVERLAPADHNFPCGREGKLFEPEPQ
jgi:hypothetical protein